MMWEFISILKHLHIADICPSFKNNFFSCGSFVLIHRLRMVQGLASRINRENHKYKFYICKEHIQLQDLVRLRIHCATEMKIKSSLFMQYVLAFRNRLLGLGILVNHLKNAVWNYFHLACFIEDIPGFIFLWCY